MTPTTPPGCYHDGKYYGVGEEIDNGQDGNHCYGTYCAEPGSVVAWDNWNCGSTTTTPYPNTTPTPPKPPQELDADSSGYFVEEPGV